MHAQAVPCAHVDISDDAPTQRKISHGQCASCERWLNKRSAKGQLSVIASARQHELVFDVILYKSDIRTPASSSAQHSTTQHSTDEQKHGTAQLSQTIQNHINPRQHLTYAA